MAKGKSYMESIVAGFRAPEELLEIENLMEKDKFLEAREKATILANRAPETFSSLKFERFLRGSALYLLGEITAKLGGNKDSIRYMEAASDLGHPFAPFQTAARLFFETNRQGNSLDRQTNLDKVFHYYLMGAELGDLACIELIQVLLKQKGNESQQNYWFLLQRMSEVADKIRQFVHFYHGTYTTEDRAFLHDVMKKESLSGGAYNSTTTAIPSRSTLVSAYVDLLMRRQLQFVWLAFFQDTGTIEGFPMADVFECYREEVCRNPLAELYLLVSQKYAAQDSAIALSSGQLVENILAGDQILVQCGHLAHYAIVWAVDIENQQIILLDPFDEFWQPSHNLCINSFERKDYKYNRHLVHLSLKEVQQILVAVMTIRNRNSEN